MQLRSIILLLSEILSELKALRKSVEEILRIQKGEDDSHADFISARKAAQILGIKTSRLWQIVGESASMKPPVKKFARGAIGMTRTRYAQ